MTSFRAERIELLPLSALRPAERNARTHSKRQLEQIKASIKRFGFTQPLLIDEACVIVAGHGRAAAAKALGMAEAPCIRIDTMTADEKRAYAIADNAIATKSGWDKEVLALELGELVDLGFDVEATGFELPEIDQLLLDADEAATTGPGQEDVAPPAPTPADAVCRPGDLWTLGRHKVLCGDAKDADAVSRLMGWEKADMVFTDAPYNLRIDGVARGRGKVRHREFAEASGEMSNEQFTEFLRITIERMSSVCKDGAIIFSCMDWRHIGELLAAGAACQLELKNICVWAKSNFGQGSFYRSQHELVTVWKHGAAPHVNTFGLGEGGRTRSNLWRYAGLNAFKANRAEELSAHPTSKPVALVADAIRDVSHRGHVVLDLFGGSGTTLIAAEKTGRRARLIEIDAPYCDVIIRRWETYTGKSGVLEATGQDFETVGAERRAAAGAPPPRQRRLRSGVRDMTDDPEKKPKKAYEVGYGKPPREHQWRPGESGNKGGRRPKLPRVLLPAQMRQDLLERLERPMVVKTADGRSETMPTILAIQEVHIRKALAGHAPNWRQLQADYKELLAQNAEDEPLMASTFERALEKIAKDEPAKLERYLIKLMSHDLKRRYVSPAKRERKPKPPKGLTVKKVNAPKEPGESE